MAQQQRFYKVIFANQGKTYEIYARQITQSELYGFVEVEDLSFGDRSGVLVDPSEEKLKDEFAAVKRTFIPIHSVVRIDEVEKAGVGKIKDSVDKVTPFPGIMVTPPAGGGEKKT